jgi:hypothetical protein
MRVECRRRLAREGISAKGTAPSPRVRGQHVNLRNTLQAPLRDCMRTAESSCGQVEVEYREKGRGRTEDATKSPIDGAVVLILSDSRCEWKVWQLSMGCSKLGNRQILAIPVDGYHLRSCCLGLVRHRHVPRTIAWRCMNIPRLYLPQSHMSVYFNSEMRFGQRGRRQSKHRKSLTQKVGFH